MLTANLAPKTPRRSKYSIGASLVTKSAHFNEALELYRHTNRTQSVDAKRRPGKPQSRRDLA